MATSDGITSEDWDPVHDFALDIVNGDGDECETLKCALLTYLDSLQIKYGELPSILATRADYVNNLEQKEQLLSRAYVLAEARQDIRNQFEIAHSLAELYIDDFEDPTAGSKWLGRLRRHSEDTGDASRRAEYERLRKQVRRLQTKLVK